MNPTDPDTCFRCGAHVKGCHPVAVGGHTWFRCPACQDEHDHPVHPRRLDLNGETWADLETIARHHGFVLCNTPDRSKAVRLLVQLEIEQLRGIG